MLFLSCWFAIATHDIYNMLQFVKFETCTIGAEVVERLYLHKPPLPMSLCPKCHV
jgi:hypothetical protein